MKEFAFIFVSKKVIWPSHEQVKKNLTHSYLNGQPKNLSLRTYRVADDLAFKSLLTRLITRSHRRPEHLHLVMLDIGLNLTLLSQLAPFMHQERVIFHLHVHGDILLRLAQWQNLLRQLVGFRVSLRVCSEAMKKLCQDYFPALPIIVIPFPIADYFFHAPSQKKNTARIISYFGRLTPDKGLLDLLYWWNQYQPPHTQLHLYGSEDPQHHLSWHDKASFDSAFQEMKNLIDQASNIYVARLKTPAALRAAMDQSHLVISLSTFKAEEYGLALREAAARGKPLHVTFWGGHKDLALLPMVSFVPVNANLEVSLEKLKLPRLNTGRSQQSKKAYQLFSTKSISKIIRRAWGSAKIIRSALPVHNASIDEQAKKYFR